MEISKPEINIEHGKVVYRVRVRSLQGNAMLWYSLDERYLELVTDGTDPALVALLLPAMARGEDIHIEGTISKRSYYNIKGSAQRLLQHIMPSLSRVGIYPANLQKEAVKGNGVATGFSGGIDSFCLLADHLCADVPTGFKVTHLLFNNVGSHGWGGEQLFKERYEHLKPAAERMGLPFISINTNVESFYGGKDYLGFQSTHTLRNASVALLLQKGMQRYMYASAYPYPNVFVGQAKDIAYVDAILLPLLSTDTLETLSVGSEYTRVEKTLRVNDIADSYDTLDVCVEPEEPGKNCSKCWKCMRTLLTMDIAGFINNYSPSFDLNVYYNHRDNYIKEVINSDNPLLLEIIEFAKKRNYSLK